jgi:hypothetical protein
MVKKLLFASFAIVTVGVFAPELTMASPFLTSRPAISDGSSVSSVEQVQWRRCRAWRRECASRWGWGGSRFRRCLARHGCL